MRGSAVFRTGVAPGGALAGPWVQNSLWTRARAVPSLDLRFADNKSLVDATTGAQLVTFTRASSGTYVGSDGVLRSAVTNLLLRSEEFDDAAWGKVGGSITANAITAPNGQATADLFTEDTSTGQHDVRVTSPTLTDGATYTFSVYSKANGRRLNITYPLVTAGHGAVFNLNDGTFTLVGDTVSASILLVGDGWYRCSCTATKSGGTSSSSLRFLTHDGTTKSYTGDGTSGIYIWGAQLEQSATVGEYIPTTSTINSAPRFDHDPTTGESLGLLGEEARTNLLLSSEEFDSASWAKTRSSITSNTIVAPDGTLTGDKLVEDTTAANTHITRPSPDPSYVTGTTYTYSVFAQAAERTFLQLRVTAGASFSAAFNLSTGVASPTSAGTTPSVTNVGNGWYRCAVTFTATATATGATRIGLMLNEATQSYTGDGTSGIYLWGAQLEEGAFPTSYIPTTTAAATRAADVASITGSNFSSWYRQDEGTVFAEATPIGDNGSNQFVYALAQGTGIAEEIFLFKNPGTNSITNTIRSSSSSQFSNSTDSLSPFGSNFKNAIGASSTSTNSAVNGVIQGLDTSVVMPTIDNLVLGRRANTTFLGNFLIRRLTYWPARLPDSTLQTITQ